MVFNFSFFFVMHFFIVLQFYTNNTFLSQVWLDATTPSEQRWGWESPRLVLIVTSLINTVEASLFYKNKIWMHLYFDVWSSFDHQKVNEMYIKDVLLFGTSCMECTELFLWEHIKVTVLHISFFTNYFIKC